MSKPQKNSREEPPTPAAKPGVISLAEEGFVTITMAQLNLSPEEQETLAGGARILHPTDTPADEQTPTSDDPPTTANIRQEVATLTFAYADREAAWLNRYNKDDKTLEWAFKEGFYQKRFQELLVLLSDDAVERLHLIISQKMTKLLTYGYAWFVGSQLMQWLTSATGFFITWAQWDAARFNKTGSTSWFTRLALKQYHLWAKVWRSR